MVGNLFKAKGVANLFLNVGQLQETLKLGNNYCTNVTEASLAAMRRNMDSPLFDPLVIQAEPEETEQFPAEEDGYGEIYSDDKFCDADSGSDDDGWDANECGADDDGDFTQRPPSIVELHEAAMQLLDIGDVLDDTSLRGPV